MADLAFSTYLANALLNATLRGISYSSPSTVYAGLWVTDPTASDTGTEVTGGSYARIAVPFDAPVASECLNTNAITFPAATGTWGNIPYIGIKDSLTLGNLLYYGELDEIVDVVAGETVSIPSGALRIKHRTTLN